MCHLSVWDSLAASQEAFLVSQLPPSSPHVPCCTQTLEVVRLSPSRCDILLVPAVLHNGVYVGCSRGGKELAHRHSKAPTNGFYLKLWKKYLEIQGAAGFPASQGRCWHQRKEPSQHLTQVTRWQVSDSAPTLPGGDSAGSVQGQRALSHRKLLPGGRWAVSAPPKVKLEGKVFQEDVA